MLRFISTYENFPVLSLRSTSTLGYVSAVIVDPKKLQVFGFYVSDARTRQTRILLIQDIRDHISKGFVVNDYDALTDPDDLVRHKELLELAFTPIGKHVESSNKNQLGKVIDYALDHKSFYIQKFHYRKSILRGFGSDLSFGRNQIVELTNKKFVIRGPEVKSNSAIKRALKPTVQAPAFSTSEL